MGPPKCKTCGKTEWGHICAGVVQLKALVDQLREHRKMAKGPPLRPAQPITPARKEYLKLKVRERRARLKAAKCQK